jgi:hypothetical protein
VKKTSYGSMCEKSIIQSGLSGKTLTKRAPVRSRIRAMTAGETGPPFATRTTSGRTTVARATSRRAMSCWYARFVARFL